MGCSCSKVDEQRPVALCRGRVELLAAAVRHRFALAGAHEEYSDSLLSFSAALHRILLSSAADTAGEDSSSPVLPLPSRRKSAPSPPPPISGVGHQHSHSRSLSGSHIHFLHSDESSSDEGDDDDDDDSGGRASDAEEDYLPIHHYQEALPPGFGYGAGGVYYGRSQPPPRSISVQQRPPRYETVHLVSSSAAAASSSSSFDPHSSTAYSSYGYAYPEPYSYFPSNSYGGHFAPYSPQPGLPPPASSSATAAPPPPSPPKESTWDFLNPFKSYESFYSSYNNYTPSRSSREVREEEGIPDLEEDEAEVVKEAYIDRGLPPFSSSEVVREQQLPMDAYPAQEFGTRSMRGSSYYYPPRQEEVGRSSGYRPPIVDKNVVGNQTRRLQPEQRNVAAARRVQDVSEVADVIKVQFERACQSARELSALLEVAKKQYRTRSSLCEVSSRMVGAVAPPIGYRRHEGLLDFEEEKIMGRESIAATLRKLYIWERKLYHEVKAEEKMRLLLNRSYKELGRLDQRGAEAHKIDSTRNLIKKLNTKVRISIQVAGSISKKINKLRDEELWPQICDLFQGLARMWTILLDCHRMQLQVISEAKVLDSVVSVENLRETHASDIMQLEMELLKWKGNFSAWINAQKNYIKALNGWLILCLNYEPKGASDVNPPYSPRQFSAPPLFVICNCWSQALGKISEREVVDAIEALAATVHHIWEQQNLEQHERISVRRDLERRIKSIEKKTQVVQKEVNSLNKKLALLPGHTNLSSYGHLHGGHILEASTVQLGLRQIFESIESFFASSVEAFEEVYNRVEEERVTRENAKVP